jgi:hypothetical protein
VHAICGGIRGSQPDSIHVQLDTRFHAHGHPPAPAGTGIVRCLRGDLVRIMVTIEFHDGRRLAHAGWVSAVSKPSPTRQMKRLRESLEGEFPEAKAITIDREHCRPIQRRAILNARRAPWVRRFSFPRVEDRLQRSFLCQITFRLPPERLGT